MVLATQGSMRSVKSPSDRQAHLLAANGATLIFVGLLCGLIIPAAAYPRLMLTAHIQFLVNGMVSLFAGLLLKTSLATVGRWGGTLVVAAHVATWAVCLSEVGAAFSGANKTLPIAAGQAGASGAAEWQETLVLVCHMIPAVLLIAAWGVLVFQMLSKRNQAA